MLLQLFFGRSNVISKHLEAKLIRITVQLKLHIFWVDFDLIVSRWGMMEITGGGKFVSWQDDSSQLHLKKKAQPATEASVASLQQMHQTSANQILQGFDDSLSLTNLSSASAAPVVQISSKQAASSARATRRPAPLKDECDAESQRFPVLKCLKGVRDPLIAASKVRKATLTQLGLLESKCSKALDLCREVLGLIQDDYDCEDHDYHLWESVAVLLDQVGSCRGKFCNCRLSEL